MRRVIIILLTLTACLQSQISVGSFESDRITDLRVSREGLLQLKVNRGTFGTGNSTWTLPGLFTFAPDIAAYFSVQVRGMIDVVEGNPTTIQVSAPLGGSYVTGYSVYLNGVGGAGCAIVNGIHPIIVTGLDTFTVAVDTTALACTNGAVGPGSGSGQVTFYASDLGSIIAETPNLQGIILNCDAGPCSTKQVTFPTIPGFIGVAGSGLGIAPLATVTLTSGQIPDASAIVNHRPLLGSSPHILNPVSGPFIHADNYFPQWNGVDTRILKEGMAGSAAATKSTVMTRDALGDTAARIFNGSLFGSATDTIVLGDLLRFKYSDTSTSYPALIGQGAATLVNHFAHPTAQAGRHYSAAFQMSSGNSGAGDKVAVYAAAQSGTGTSDIWAGNFLAQHNVGDADVNIQAIEIDVNEQDADQTLMTGKFRTALSLTSGGLKHPGAWGALYVNATNKAVNGWRTAIHLDGFTDRGINTRSTDSAIPLYMTHVSNDTTSPNIYFAKARGSFGAETSVLNNDRLILQRGLGYVTGTGYLEGPIFAAYASENWTAAAKGANFFFAVPRNGTTLTTATVTIPNYGGISLSNGVGTLPTPACDVDHRGTFFYQPGAAGVKDTVQVCAKDAANVYAWRVIY